MTNDIYKACPAAILKRTSTFCVLGAVCCFLAFGPQAASLNTEQTEASFGESSSLGSGQMILADSRDVRDKKRRG